VVDEDGRLVAEKDWTKIVPWAKRAKLSYNIAGYGKYLQ
jgi:hypothetical protein